MSGPRLTGDANARRFHGVVLMTIGSIMFILFGLYTIGVSAAPDTGEQGVTLLATILGGVPMVAGAMLFLVGRRLYRRS